jgi:hypothetical protein
MSRSIGTLLAATLLAAPAFADQSQARLQVSVSVPALAAVASVGSVDTLTLSVEDVARGYKDLRTRYRVTHNNPGGYLLRFAPRLGLAREVEVRGLGAAFVLRDVPVDVGQPAAARSRDVDLEFRVVLDGAARPGTYALPVQLAAVPL